MIDHGREQDEQVGGDLKSPRAGRGPLSSSTMRSEYASSRCNSSDFVGVSFPGSLSCTQWTLSVQKNTALAWVAFADVMRRHSYFYLESGGGTYSCRYIADSSEWSLHAYGLALDLNPSKNPDGSTNTDQPAAFRADLKAITAGGRQVFAWGGDWYGQDIDTMHWQIGATKNELAAGVVDPNLTAEELEESMERERDIYALASTV